MGEIFNMVVRIGADVADLKKKVGDAEKQVGTFSDTVGSASKHTMAAAAALGAGFLAVATAAVAMALAAGRQAEELSQLSMVLGIGTSKLQEYDVLLNRTGLSGEDLAVSMRTLSAKMEEARTGVGAAADRFRQLGIDITKVTGTDDLIRKIAESVSHMANGTQKAAIMADLFGRAGLKFIPAFEGGAKAIDQAAAASARLAATLSGQQLDVLGKMDDAVDDLTLAWKRFSQQMSAVLAPSVQMVTEALTAMLGVGSRVLQLLDTAADTLAIRFSHLALSVNEVGRVLFSSAALSADAWKQVAANLALINQEAVKQIANRRALDALGSPADVRAAAPALIDSTKAVASLQKIHQAAGKVQEALGKQLVEGFIELERVSGRSLDAVIPKLFAMEQALKLGEIQTDAGTAATLAGGTAWQAHRDSLSDAVEMYSALEENQTSMFQSERGMLGAADAARRVSFARIQAEEDQKRQSILDTFGVTERSQQMLVNLEESTMAQRRAIVQQFPTFFESQMQAIVSSNSFSMGSMISTWTGGLAQMAVHGGNFQAVWEQTQVAIVQAALNAGVQMLAQQALQASVEWGLLTAEAAAKLGLKTASTAAETGVVTAGAAAQVVAVTTGNGLIVASNAVAAGKSVTIWGAATKAIVSMFGATAKAFKTIFIKPLIAAVKAVGVWIMKVLTAVASASKATIFGIPLGVAILAGVVLIGTALAATGNIPGLADGGIVNRPTLAMIGEAGPEAVVPLSRGRGRGGFGGGEGGEQTIIIELDGRVIARAMVKALPREVRLSTGVA